jgi:ERCC4-type nuclease
MKQTKKEKMNEKIETNKGKYHTTYFLKKIKNRFKKEKNKIESKQKRKKTYNNEKKNILEEE